MRSWVGGGPADWWEGGQAATGCGLCGRELSRGGGQSASTTRWKSFAPRHGAVTDWPGVTNERPALGLEPTVGTALWAVAGDGCGWPCRTMGRWRKYCASQVERAERLMIEVYDGGDSTCASRPSVAQSVPASWGGGGEG